MTSKSEKTIRVNVIDAHIVVLDENLSFLWFWNWKVSLVLQHFGAAILFDDDALHGLWNGLRCHGSKMEGNGRGYMGGYSGESADRDGAT